MGVYDTQIATAKRLIAAKGQLVTWRQLPTTLPDSDKPWQPSADMPNDFDAKIVFITMNRMGRELLRFLSGTEVTTGTVRGLMAASSFEPSTKDVIFRDNKTLRIISIDPLCPNGETILYTIEFAE